MYHDMTVPSSARSLTRSASGSRRARGRATSAPGCWSPRRRRSQETCAFTLYRGALTQNVATCHCCSLLVANRYKLCSVKHWLQPGWVCEWWEARCGGWARAPGGGGPWSRGRAAATRRTGWCSARRVGTPWLGEAVCNADC